MNLVRFNNSNRNFGWSSPVFDDFSGYIDRINGLNNCKEGHDRSAPLANISETKEKFNIEIAAPGFNKKDFKINLENNILSISSEVVNNNEDKVEKYSRKEFYYNTFKRTFSLSKNIDTEKISAEYKNGILRIILPKLEEAKEKPIRDIKIS